jgi:hypothetical protein
VRPPSRPGHAAGVLRHDCAGDRVDPAAAGRQRPARIRGFRRHHQDGSAWAPISCTAGWTGRASRPSSVRLHPRECGRGPYPGPRAAVHQPVPVRERNSVSEAVSARSGAPYWSSLGEVEGRLPVPVWALGWRRRRPRKACRKLQTGAATALTSILNNHLTKLARSAWRKCVTWLDWPVSAP